MRDDPVPPGELTAADLEVIDQIAAQMILAGLWHSIRRIKEAGCDCVEIRVLDSRHSTLTVGMLSECRYFHMDNRTSAVHIGETLVAVLEQAGLLLPEQARFGRWCGSSFAVNVAPGVTRNQ